MENSRHYVVFNVWNEDFWWHDNGDPPSFTSFRKETVGSLGNYDDDHNDNFKKTIGLMIKTTALHVHHAF